LEAVNAGPEATRVSFLMCPFWSGICCRDRQQSSGHRGLSRSGNAATPWSIVARMALKLHRCSTRWRVGPCWRVQKALEEQGIDYEVVKGPARPGKRTELQRISGQKLYPVIEFENGAIYREESKDMAATIRAGQLDEKRGASN
jgi:hypothetical protein